MRLRPWIRLRPCGCASSSRSPSATAGVRRRRPALAPSRLLPPAGGRASTFPRSADLVAPPHPGARAWIEVPRLLAPPTPGAVPGCSRRRRPARPRTRGAAGRWPILTAPPPARAAAFPFSPSCSRRREERAVAVGACPCLAASPAARAQASPRLCLLAPPPPSSTDWPALPLAPGGGGRCSRRAQAAPQIGGCTGRRCPNLRCARCAAFN